MAMWVIHATLPVGAPGLADATSAVVALAVASLAAMPPVVAIVRSPARRFAR
jgi:hypothetical protein